MTEEPIKVFFSYSRSDEKFKDELVKRLIILQRQGVVSSWNDRMIEPGSEWEQEINTHLSSADIILLLVSPDFLASNYCWDVEVNKAMQRHAAGEACVIPVILRRVDWDGTPLAKFQALPKDAKPITSWNDQDEAFYDVARGIKVAVENLYEARQQRRIREKQAAEKAKLEAELQEKRLAEERAKLETEAHQRREKEQQAELKRLAEERARLEARERNRLIKLKRLVDKRARPEAKEYNPQRLKYLLLVGGACGIILAIFSNLQSQPPNQPDATAAYNQGVIISSFRDKRSAIEYFDKAILFEPNFADPYYARGLIRKEQGDKQGAIADFRKAADLFQKQGNSGGYQKALALLKELQP